MTAKRALGQVDAPQLGIGAPTIMDRVLAARHGAPYVRLAAFAIDIDRAYGHDPEPDARPLGWEVFLCERQLLVSLAPEDEATCALLEDLCLGVLEQPPEQQALGSAVVFAVHDGVRRGRLPASLAQVFAHWRKPPKQLTAALDQLWGEDDGVAAAAQLATVCLSLELEPPLSPPTRQALQQMIG